MIDLARMIQEERERLQRIRETTEQRLQCSANLEGKLRISTKKNQVSYYHRLPEGTTNGEYISKKEMELIRGLAQKTYDEKVLKLVSKREKQFQRLLKEYRSDEIERLYLDECPFRQDLIIPVEPTWEQKLQEWIKKPYQGRSFGEGAPLIRTNRGERVRSKSEKILADYFFQNHIPYKYECPLYLKPYGIVYPDFTFLSPSTGKEIYWEHEGRMDDPDYARKAINKIELYQSNGLLIGEQLILTFETSTTVLNMDSVKKTVEQYLQ